MQTVFDVFSQSVKNYGDRPFLHIPASAARGYSDGALDYTYGEMNGEAEKRTAAYRNAGYGPGHRVAILLENRPDFFFHWLALNALGVGIIPLNGEASPQDIHYIIFHGDADLVVSLPEKMTLVQEALDLETDADRPPLCASDLNDLPAADRPAETFTPDSTTECAMLFTSGSTGQPKGCVLSNEYFTAFGDWYRNVGGYCELKPGEDRLLTPLPLVHMNALACSTMGMMAVGGCIIQLDRFHPGSWWKSVRDSGATIVHYLGVLPAILLNMDPTDDDTAHNVRFGFGAGVNPKHHAAFEERFGFPLIEAWAMTESGCGGCIIASHEPRHVGECCFGKATDQVEFRLVDDDGVDVEKGLPGELLVRAAGDNPRCGFFDHYHKNEDATAEIWEDNWLHTGDIARQGPDGSLYFVDRKKNVVRRSGENISALEVENVLLLDPAVDSVAVAPVYDEMRGDEVMALIVPKAGQTAGEPLAREIFDRSMEQLTYYKTPGYIAFVTEMPLTASKKLKRGDVKTLCGKLVEEKNAIDLRHLKKRPKKQGATA
ncbi:AMP-binding protein [Emcibacter sp.]|uniref:AMP-binding protein n=1 Tax=Emcibacter sp. TaxID=1979954 RepID=UPI002AA8FDE3|nr:AMP-binding protein [Emcibacter sp.]